MKIRGTSQSMQLSEDRKEISIVEDTIGSLSKFARFNKKEIVTSPDGLLSIDSTLFKSKYLNI